MVPDDVRGGRRFVAAEVLSPSALSAPFPGVVWDTSVDAVLDAYRATFGVVTQLIVDSSSGAAARTVHSDEYVDFILEGSDLELDERSFPLYFVRREDAVFTKPTSYLGRHTGFFFDEVTRATPEVCRSALLAAATALRAGEWVSSGASGEVRMGLAVCRPPGHHAFPGFGGGICIFANAAIAARALKESGTVAVLDLDADHVHRLAVEPAWRGNQRAGQQRRGIGFRRRRARADLPARDRTACLGHAILDGVDRTAIRQGEGWRHLKAAAPRFEQGAHRV